MATFFYSFPYERSNSQSNLNLLLKTCTNRNSMDQTTCFTNWNHKVKIVPLCRAVLLFSTFKVSTQKYIAFTTCQYNLIHFLGQDHRIGVHQNCKIMCTQFKDYLNWIEHVFLPRKVCTKFRHCECEILFTANIRYV